MCKKCGKPSEMSAEELRQFDNALAEELAEECEKLVTILRSDATLAAALGEEGHTKLTEILMAFGKQHGKEKKQ